MRQKLTTVAFIFFTFCVTAQNNINWASKVDSLAKAELKKTKIPSLQIAIGKNNQIVYNNSFGKADLEFGVDATTQTKYRTASISKLWTATIAMILEEKGILNLDTPISSYCKHINKKITSRQLLTHTAGIRSYIDLENGLKSSKTKEDSISVKNRYQLEQLSFYKRHTEVSNALDHFKNDALLFTPGTDWHYSSQGYVLLACVLEGVTGKKYQDLVKEYIFTPANMTNSSSDDSWKIIKNRATGYRLQGGILRNADMRDVSANLPAGGHLSTAEDLTLFAQNFINLKFTTSKTFNTMTSAFSSNPDTNQKLPLWRYAIPNKYNYGYGVMLFPSEDTIRFGHTGRQAGASSIVVMIPEKQLIITVLTNVKGWNGYMSLTKKIEDILSK